MAKRGGYNMGMMPGNMNNLMKQAQRIQKQMETTTKELEDKIYESSVGGGVVTAKVSGKKELMEIKLDPEVVDPDDIETLEDLIISAVNEAFRMQDEDYQENMNKISGGMGLGRIHQFRQIVALMAVENKGYRDRPQEIFGRLVKME